MTTSSAGQTTKAQSTTDSRMNARELGLAQGPVLPVLVSLALPNIIAMVAVASVSIAETVYIAVLGRESLAAIAVALPLVILMQNLSAGAMGGGVSSAISRALGAEKPDVANELAWHAAIIGIVTGVLFTLGFAIFGPALYALLGAKDAVLSETIRYGTTLFLGAVPIWVANMFVSIVRGTGNMTIPSIAIFGVAAVQIVAGAILGLGLGPVPRLGMIGVALGQVLAFSTAAVCLGVYLFSRHSRISLRRENFHLRRDLFWQILRVGLMACISPFQTVMTVVVITAFVSRIGVDALAGYGIGARLEFLLVPIAFGVGVATLPMVGIAIGRDDIARARRVAWTGALLSAGAVGLIGLVVCLWPLAWPGIFTSQPDVLRYAGEYLRYAGPGYAFFGLGLTLFFASQGAGKVGGPVLAGTLRLVLVVLGGFTVLALRAPSWAYFVLVSLAMIVYGLAAALSVARADWRRS